MNRDVFIEHVTRDIIWDFLIIGGGASGLGTAVDAASRGFKTILFERHDFSKGTSSRSTKLVHGGVRYLAQGHIQLVKEALKERGLLANNAKHLFRTQTFIIPVYKYWERYYYALGLKIYDFLSKRLSLGKTQSIGRKNTMNRFPTLETEKLKGGIAYKDGQFDDARLAVNLAQTASEHGATVLNYMEAVALLKDKDDTLTGVEVRDVETNKRYKIKAKAIINTTGVFVQDILKMDNPKQGNVLVPSQGVHLVFDASFLKSKDAIMIPKTSDGRVLFVIPWQGKTLVGTTDTLVDKPSVEPQALEEEIDFILQTAGQYLNKKPTRKDVLSLFAGLRPLVLPDKKNIKTKQISRNYTIRVDTSGLISVIGGKWTIYRKMAEHIVDKAIQIHRLPEHKSITKQLNIHGNLSQSAEKPPHPLDAYGSDRQKIETLIKQNPTLKQRLHPAYSYTLAEVVWGIRNEMARTVEDILARRMRLLFLDARAAIQVAPVTAKILAEELNKNEEWAKKQEAAFIKTAQKYLLI